MKMLAFLLLVGSLGVAGVVMSLSLAKRRRQLEAFSLGLELLEAEMVFAQNPLWLCFSNVSDKLEGNVAQVFKEISRALSSSNYDNGEAAFDESLAKYKDALYLIAEDWDIIERLGCNLGLTDKQRQSQRLHITIDALALAIGEAKTRESKWQRIYGLGGWMMGLICGLLLI